MREPCRSETRGTPDDPYTRRFCRKDGYPLGLLSLRHGWADEGKSGSGSSIGISIPLHFAALVTSQLDLYRQLDGAGAGGVHGGVGVVASPVQFAPYVLFGRAEPREWGWYSSQALSFPSPFDMGYFTGAPEIFWAPALTIQGPLERRPEAEEGIWVGQLHLFGTLGVRRYSEPPGTVPRGGLGAAVSIEFR